MDNSISKALIIVASVLLAMIVIAFMTFTINRTGTWATAQDDEILTKQKDEFNREYEAYDKDLMYGLDVISCLNKAKSNNDQIQEREKINGNTYDKSYAITVSVEIKKVLQEGIIVYNRGETTTKEEETSGWNSGYQISDVGFKVMELKKTESTITNFCETDDLMTTYKDSNMKANSYTLTYDWKETDTGDRAKREGILREKLKISERLTETIKNIDKIECKSFLSDEKTKDGKFWTKAVYKSALYDMKTRKFKCTNIEYNSQTGRVNKIEFEEIK